MDVKLRELIESLAKRPGYVDSILGMLKVDGGAEMLLEGIFLGEGVTIEAAETAVTMTMRPPRKKRGPRQPNKHAFTVDENEPLDPLP